MNVANENDQNSPSSESWAIGRKRLAQSLMLEEEGPGGIIRFAALLIVLFLGAFGFWATQTKMIEVISSSGEVSPIGSVKRVQHLTGGIVTDILVAPGDIVKKGDIIMSLDPVDALARGDQLRTRLAGLELEARQLQAILSGEAVDVSNDAAESQFAVMQDSQAQILLAKREAMEAQKVVVDKQIAQKGEEGRLLRDQRKSIERQMEILNEQVDMRQTLADKGLISKILMLDYQREQAGLEGKRTEVLGQIRRLAEEIAELESRKIEIDTRLAQEAAENLGKLNAEIAELRASISQADTEVSRARVISPANGVVQNFQTETVGGVLAPGETVLEVIPTDAELNVEARITTNDIGFVFRGQEARIKVLTYDYTRYGEINGVIDRISATTLEDEQGNPFFRANIRLEKNYVGDDPSKNVVLPGMTVIADIRTGEKTLAEYLLKPIYTALDQAFRER